MKLLAEDKFLQKEMVAKGLERLENYSWGKCAEEHLKLFSKITNASLSSS